MSLFGFSIVETARLDRIEDQLKQLNKKADKLKMTIEELGTAIDELGAQLNKALGEILTEIQGLGTVPQAIVDKVVAAKAVAQQLDDLNPDQPAPQT